MYGLGFLLYGSGLTPTVDGFCMVSGVGAATMVKLRAATV